MTLVTGTVQDLGHAPMDGTLYARPARFLPSGGIVYAPERTPYKIAGGTFSVELAPGPAVLELKVGTHARDEFRVVIPDQVTVDLADLIEEVFPWEPEQVSTFVAERELAVQAKKDAETAAGQASTAAGTATTAAQQTGQDRSHVDQVRALLDETYDESQAGMALPPRLMESALKATYAGKGLEAEVEDKIDEAEADLRYAEKFRTAQRLDCRTIVLGDSIDADPRGWWPYFVLQSKRIKTIRNAGVPGNTTTAMRDRMQSDVIAHSPDVVVLGGATNDIGQGVAESVTRGNIMEMVETVRAYGGEAVLRTTPPADAAGAVPIETRRAATQRHNAWLKGYAAQNGIDVLDVYQSVVDPATGGFKAGITTDGIHPTETGSKAIADYLLQLPLPSVFKGGFAFARAVQESGNLITNGVFVGDSNGDGLANGWSPMSWVGGVESGAKSLTPGDVGVTGNWQRITGPDAAACIFGQDFAAGYSAGDVVDIAGRVRTSGTATGLIRLTFWSSTTPPIDLLANTSKPVDGVFSARATIPNDLTRIRLQVQTSGAAGWIEVAEVAVRNLTALGLV